MQAHFASCWAVALLVLLGLARGNIVEDLDDDSDGLARENMKIRFLACPVRGDLDISRLQSFAGNGLEIDILEERVVEKGGFVHVLATGNAAKVLLAQARCMEQKSSAMGLRMIQPQRVSDEIVTGKDFDLDYRSFQAISAQIAHYRQNYPHLFHAVEVIGKSYEGRDLLVVHMTAASAGREVPVPQIWIQASQHAREWIAAASLFAAVNKLIAGYEAQDPRITNLLNNFELVLMPMVNPDGYEYSRKVNRMWRKNRAKPHGVDLNRNWDASWGQFGCPSSTSSDVFCGSGPASEPEVSAVQNYVLNRLPNRVLGLDVHSFSQLVLYNYGYTTLKAPIDSALKPMSTAIAQAMTQVANQKYIAQQSAGFSAVCGGADDWFYLKAGVPGFTLEMRDRGAYGFRLPASQIPDSGAELLAGLLAAVDSLPAISSMHAFPNAQIVF